MSHPWWALYATNHRLGTWRLHRLAGARVGRVGVHLEQSVPSGWKASINVSRVSLGFTLATSQKDPLLAEFFEAVMPPKEELKETEADMAAGRFYILDPETDETHPNPDWPSFGPQPSHT